MLSFVCCTWNVYRGASILRNLPCPEISLVRVCSFGCFFQFEWLRSNYRRWSLEKAVLKNFAKFTGKHLGQSLFFNKVTGLVCNFIKKETLAQVFSCKFSVIFKNTFFYLLYLLNDCISANSTTQIFSLKDE